MGYIQINCPWLVIPNKILLPNPSAPEVKHLPGIPFPSSYDPPQLEIYLTIKSIS